MPEMFTMNVPEGQDAGTGAELPAGQSEPTGHGLHDGWLASSWYSPTTQLSHSALPLAADVPVLQLRGASEPTTQKPPAGQTTQSDSAAPRGAARYEPSAHSVTALAPAPHQPPASHASHAVAFDDDWNSPASHSKHASRPLTFAKPPGAHSIGSLELGGQ